MGITIAALPGALGQPTRDLHNSKRRLASCEDASGSSLLGKTTQSENREYYSGNSKVSSQCAAGAAS